MEFGTLRMFREWAKEVGVSRDKMPAFLQSCYHQAFQVGDYFTVTQSHLGSLWEKAGRPYYNVWPAIMPMVKNLTLDITSTDVPPIDPPLCLRIPLNSKEFSWDDQRVYSILIGVIPKNMQVIVDAYLKNNLELPVDVPWDIAQGRIAIMIDIRETRPSSRQPVFTFRYVTITPGASADQIIRRDPSDDSIRTGIQIPEEIMDLATRLAFVVCLIGDDPELLSPDILAKDRPKWDKATEAEKLRMLDKAKKRGKNGFDLGKQLELIPHYRRPHLAKVWTGKGRAKLKVVMRKGAVVHREQAVKVPTGYAAEA